MSRKFTVVAIDDEKLATKLIEKFCESHKKIHFVKSFNSALSGMDFLLNNQVDILFLDIEMPEINGLDFAEKCSADTKIIFTTAFGQFAIDAFNLAATDYLLKPFSNERFDAAIQKTMRLLELELKEQASPAQKSIHVKSNYVKQKILIENILYVESFGDYVTIHLANNKQISSRRTLKDLLEELPSKQFMRIHRSYVISLQKVTKFQKTSLFIGEKKIMISAMYKTEFWNTMKTR